MAIKLPPPPYATPISDADGRLNFAWTNWFKQAFIRIGEMVAPSNSELASTTDVNTLTASVNTNKSNISTNTTNISTNTSDISSIKAVLAVIGVGRQL